MRNSQEVEDFNLFTSPLSHPAFQKGDSMNLEELKQWTTDRLDYEDNEIGKEHSEYRGHYYAGVLALLAKLEAAQRLRDDLMQIMAPTVSNMREAANQSHMVAMAIAAFDKEQQ